MMNNKKFLIIAGVVLVILVGAVAVAVKLIMGQVGPVTLTYWGLWEPESVYAQVIDDYKRTHPNVTVKYQKMAPQDYRDRLTTALAREGGPDIVRIHNSWVPMMKNSLQPVGSMTPEEMKNTFYPVASNDLVAEGKVWAVPLGIDTIVMYVNQDILSSGGLDVPTTWDDFSRGAAKLTNGSGALKISGTALGGTANVDHWQEILGLMMMQVGAKPTADPASSEVAEALKFYTGFESVDHDWDETQDVSTLAFANGKVGMYFAPSWRYFDIKDINSTLRFKVAPVPQLAGGTNVNYATYWAEAISKKSAHPKEAADFLKFISSKEELAKIYTAESKLRDFGEPYSRVDMANTLAADPVAGIVVSSAPTAKSWYLASATNDGDTGINSRLAKYYLDAVNAMNQRGADATEMLGTISAGVAQVLGSYGVVRTQ